jgi:hypothetical protein|tara:strand:+ start:282 stop:404 length:123 start_codon:yes stop_codon:yes gene_type:complete
MALLDSPAAHGMQLSMEAPPERTLYVPTGHGVHVSARAAE